MGQDRISLPNQEVRGEIAVANERADPNCAICYWGEAWSWGSYLNGPMPPANAPFAYAAIQKALKLAPDHASPVERAFIEAMSVRYIQNFTQEKRREQDTTYAEAARKLHERFPKDLDAGTLYGESLFVMEMQPASYAILAVNEAEKATRIKVVDYRMIGATGRVYVTGDESEVRAASDAATAALEAIG